MSEINKFNKVADLYDKYRPNYPNELITDIVKKCKLDPDAIIADIGAGTGILTRKLLEQRKKIIAIEPDDDMREILVDNFRDNNNLKIMATSAEDTKIPSNTIDLITVAQAFHWFAIEEFRKECERILKPQGNIFILWNKINMEDEIVKQMKEIDYKYTQQYKEIKSVLEKEKMEHAINIFFKDKEYEEIVVRNDIQYDKETFIGYNLSKSYSLRSIDNKYEEYVKSFEELFEKYQIDGVINISNYVCGYLGKL